MSLTCRDPHRPGRTLHGRNCLRSGWTSATTSAVASAMIGPRLAPADDPGGVHERVGVGEFTALADVAGSGVALRRGRLASRQAGPPMPGWQPCAPVELPGGFAAGFWARLPLVDMPLYLDYLIRRLAAAGGRIVQAEVESLTDLADQAPLIANCAGWAPASSSRIPQCPRCAASRSSLTTRDVRSSSSQRRSSRPGRRTGPTRTMSFSAALGACTTTGTVGAG